MGLSNDAANAGVAAIAARLDAGAGAAKLKLYTTNYGTLLATVTLGDPAFSAPAVSSGNSVATLAGTPITATFSASGTVESFEFTTSVDAIEYSAAGVGAVGLSGSGALVELTTLSAVSDAPFNVTSGTLALPIKFEGEA